MTDLIDTTEMYLRTILELEEDSIVPLRARISERLGHSGPTVSQTVARMERDGLVVVTGDRHLELTEEGRRKAVNVMRKHRLAERLLSDVIQLEWEYIHEEACRWEHVMSEQVERKLVTMLGHPTESPYGNPIPGLGALDGEGAGETEEAARLVNLVEAVHGVPAGGAGGAGAAGAGVSGAGAAGSAAGGAGAAGSGAAGSAAAGSGAASDSGVTARIRRLGEPAQVDPELLLQLKQAGVFPGATGTFSAAGSYVAVQIDGFENGLELPNELAAHIFVDA